MAKLSERLDRLRRVAPEGPTAYGQLYKKARGVTSRRYRKATLYTLFRSDENTFLLRPHVFAKDAGKTPAEWSTWFAKHLKDIHLKAVLPGLAIRTQKHWAVNKILGWVGSHAQYATRHSKKLKSRHQTKRQRRTRG